MVFAEIVGGNTPELLTWGQVTVLASVVFSIVTSTGYLTRQIDKKLNIVDYEKRHEILRERSNNLEVRVSLLEERYNYILKILEKNGIKDKH